MEQSGQVRSGKVLANWLDSIQQDSWQLELLISGFAIFLLNSAQEWIWSLEQDLIILQLTSEQFFALDPLYYTGRVGFLVLLAGLILHVALRGLWIAAVGLRSVSGDIDYESFRFQPRYLNRLKNRIGSFDDYIERLERSCSILFSFAFLTFFCVVGASLFIFIMAITGAALGHLFGEDPFGGEARVMKIYTFVVLAIGLIYAIDFVSLGWLKRQRWAGKAYYFIYIVMGWVTLARFYRPLYYNLIDNRFGRRLARIIPIGLLALLVIGSLRYNGYSYIPGYLRDGQAWVFYLDYLDEVEDYTEVNWRATLESRFALNNYAELFIPYIPINDDEMLTFIDSSLVAGRNVGPYLTGGISAGERNVEAANNDDLLNAFDQKYRIWVNDSLREIRPRFYYHPKRSQHGILYTIPTHDLPVGEQRLRIGQRMLLTDSVAYTPGRVIYFYK